MQQFMQRDLRLVGQTKRSQYTQGKCGGKPTTPVGIGGSQFPGQVELTGIRPVVRIQTRIRLAHTAGGVYLLTNTDPVQLIGRLP